MSATLQLGVIAFFRDPADGYACSTWPTGEQLSVRTVPGQGVTAKDYGYGLDVLRMNMEHDATHHLLAQVLLGLPWSPTLAHEAHVADASAEWRAVEETLCRYVQRCMNGAEFPWGRLAEVVEAAACLRRGEG